MPDAPDTALIAVNLGTPEAPTAPAVRRYLGEFLLDPRVVQLSRWIWYPLLFGLILPLRGPRAAHKYAQIWLPEGSPLAVHTRRLAEAIQQRLPHWRVVDAMRYGQPALPERLRELRQAGIRRLIVLPLYPQYSSTTTESVKDVLAREAKGFDLTVIDDYSVDAGWVGAVADSIRDWRTRNGAGEHLLFSFHGLPQRLAREGDPYPQRCEASSRAIAAALGLGEGEWTLTYQSRFGKERWLEPATDATLDAMAARGLRKVDVVCPGFAVDCLETLEEVAIGFVQRFAERGGELRYIPCLNASPAHADALAALARQVAGEPA
ncbi:MULTISPECIES: ferrochelatase [unclassified Pseudoxanthomonas]|uniref:ferrochelatase n=1 Tax=unclassified Pseudoxanthomonas TaxID=2645906 RepID=UPI0016227D1C|nr:MULTISPECIES: ferrochelatase [unclassified Pseudoxanthomonas]MBB3276173.1 ferrochelatase [Pseudoxanthomonas sp. OG2]MBD9377759.1 ferrochelatase [Pseudoxanthomonas sp. PXM04]MBV7472748.1 ferrochelatase [Pseudoxanthomonas sp. PXM05]